MFCASISAAWDFSVNLFRSITVVVAGNLACRRERHLAARNLCTSGAVQVEQCARASHLAAAILAAVESGILPPGNNLWDEKALENYWHPGLSRRSFRRAGSAVLRQAGCPPLQG